MPRTIPLDAPPTTLAPLSDGLPEMLTLARVRDPPLPPETDTITAWVPPGFTVTVLPVIEMRLLGSLGMPAVAPGPAVLLLLTSTWMPVLASVIVLLSMSALSRSNFVVAVPVPTMLIARPAAPVVAIVLLEICASVTAPSLLSMSIASSAELLIVLRRIVRVPLMLLPTSGTPLLLKVMAPSAGALPARLMVLSTIEKLVTPVPLIALAPVDCRFI